MQHTGYIRRYTGGFTLSEILITLVILGFIGALGVPMLGQQKLKKPIEIKAMHGTMECFWRNGSLIQYTSNNTDNKSGEEEDVTAQGACYFTAPTANLFVLQAVGAGGGGAVGMPGAPRYTNATVSVSGSIPTSQGFLAAMNDKEKVPDWVREEWDKQWSGLSKNKWPQYVIESPVGSGGSAVCEPRVLMTDPECAHWCEVDIAQMCPITCRDDLEAKGGNSGNGSKYIVASKLEYSPEGQQDTVVFTYSTTESKLEIGSKSAVLQASEKGEDAKMNIPSYGVAQDGKKGEDFKNSQASISGMEIINKTMLSNARKGGTDCDHITGEYAKVGSVKTYSNSSIPFATDSLGINATFGVAGSPGSSVMRLLEKMPAKSQLMLVPPQSNKVGPPCVGTAGTTCAFIYLKDEATGTWKPFMEAPSGSDGWGGTAKLAVEQGDLPFPKAYYPDSFRAATPELSIASGASYKSYLAENAYIPGASGPGAHPIVTYVAGNATHRINGVVTGNTTLTPISGADATCYDGSNSNGGTCGTGNTSGNPGAVVISW